MRRGAEAPRIFTPPLRELTPETTLGFEVIGFASDVLGMELLPWQKWLLIHALETIDAPDGWRLRFRTVVVLVARQNGKALALDTDIPTPDGWRKMGDIHPGDYVFGKDGEPVRVMFESEVFHKPMYRVTFEDGAEVEASGDHLWTVSTKASRRRGEEWHVTTTEQMASDYVFVRKGNGRKEFKYRVPMQGAVQYGRKDLPVDPYLLGAWLGDGISESGMIAIGEEDVPAMVPLIENCGYPLERRSCKSDTGKVPMFFIDRRGKNVNRYGADSFYNRLKGLGVLCNKHIPEEYMTASIEQRWELLRGLMDTDGYCSKAGQCEFTQKKRALAEQVVELCASLGIKARLHEKRATCNGVDAGVVYRVIFYTTKGASCFKLKRKHERLKKTLTQNVNGKSVAKVERIENKPSKCIMVDSESHLYLAGRQYTATHNTTLGAVLSLYFLYCLRTGLVIGTAQDLEQAEDTWSMCVEMAQENADLAAEVAHVWYTNGAKRLQLTGGRDYRVRASTRKAGRGKSADLVLLDELREHQSWEAYGALSKTGIAKRNALLWCMSNAGDGTSVVLRHFRQRAHAMLGDPDGIGRAAASEPLADDSALDDTALGLFEWSAPPDADPADRDAWAQANPSMGWTIEERTLAAAQADDPPDVFKTECLCQWVTASVAPPFPVGAWEAGTDPQSIIADDAPLWWGVDISEDRGRASVAVCGMRPDRSWHIELAEYRQGVGWLQNWFAERAPRYHGMKVALQAKGAPVSSFADILGAIDGVEIVPCQGPDVAGWCGRLWDAVGALDPDRDPRAEAPAAVHHRPQPALDLAANVAATRPMGDGAWAWDRKKSLEDISPLVACTMAFGAATSIHEHRASAYAEEGAGLLVL